MLENKNLTEMKIAFNGLISRWDTAEERISELDVCQQKFVKLKSKVKKGWKNVTDYPRTVGQLQKM